MTCRKWWTCIFKPGRLHDVKRQVAKINTNQNTSKIRLNGTFQCFNYLQFQSNLPFLLFTLHQGNTFWVFYPTNPHQIQYFQIYSNYDINTSLSNMISSNTISWNLHQLWYHQIYINYEIIKNHEICINYDIIKYA